MKIKPLLVVVLAMLMAALTFGTLTPPCAGGTYQGSYTVRTCERPDHYPCDDFGFLIMQTYDQKCDIWCCPGGSTSVYNNCGPATKNGCCRLRTDQGQASPQIIYDDNQPRVYCESTATE